MRLRIFSLLLGVAVLATTSCKKELDINTDPNNPTLEQLTPKLVFPAGVASAAGRVGGDLSIVGNIWSQFYTQGTAANQYKDIDAFNLTGSFGNTNRGVAWYELFNGALNDLQFVINKAKAANDWSYLLAGTVMKAWTYQNLVDLYDQVPYTEAFKGLENLQPKFDSGYAVYKGLLAELDTALSKDFTAKTVSPLKPELVFQQEEIDPWIEFANTLKLKMYLRMVYARPQEAEAGIRALYNSNARFLDRNAWLDIFEDAENKRNPLYTYAFKETSSSNLKASVTFLSWLQANNDPRLDDYFAEAGTGGYLGINQGDFSNTNPAFNSASNAIVNPDDPVDFISLAESHFLQAEALERFFNGTGAKAHYDAGVTEAFKRYAEDAEPFIKSGGKYAYPTGATFEPKLEAIIVQKWASMPKSHALEAYFEHNRTGYPRTSAVYSTSANYIPGRFVYPKEGVTGGLFAKRLLFPDIETSKNANAPKASANPITKKVWWDVR
jgi:hypothetical protein